MQPDQDTNMAMEWGGGVDTEWGPGGVYEADRSRARGDQRGEGARGDHKNNIPLVGRVLGQVRLYGERGRGGGDRDGHQDHQGESRAS